MIEKVAKLVGSSSNTEAQMKVMNSMSEMMSTQAGTMMDFVQAAADLQLGPQSEKESPFVKAIEAGIKGLGAIGKVKRPPGQVPGQQALPPPAQ